MKSGLKLSVIIPFFNRAKFLRAAVESVLREAIPGMEVIAVDDGSTDGGAETLNGLGVRLIKRPENSGPARARNAGFQAAAGDFIYFFDSDDLLVDGALNWALTELQRRLLDPAIGGRVGTVIDEAGRELLDAHSLRYCSSQNRPAVLTKSGYLSGKATAGGLPLFLFRKSFLEEVGPLDETLRVSEDREYLLRILSRSAVPLFDRPIIHRRVHAENLSAESSAAGWAFKSKAKAMSMLIDLSNGTRK